MGRTAIWRQATGWGLALFGYLKSTSYVASGRRMANLARLTTPNEVRLAGWRAGRLARLAFDVQLGEAPASICPCPSAARKIA